MKIMKLEFKATIHFVYLLEKPLKYQFSEVKIFTGSSAKIALEKANLYCKEKSNQSFCYKVFDIEKI